MPNFCGHCGAGNEGGKFCTSCGSALADAPRQDSTAVRPRMTPSPPAPTYEPPPLPPANRPTSPPAGPPPTAPPGYTRPGQGFPPAGYQQQVLPPAAPARPAVPRVNPFLGVPIGDYARDAAAAFCLLASLGMPWDAQTDGSDRWWVAIAVLLSIASLALPYVGKAGLVPGWTPQHVRLAKIAANVPFLAAVVAVLVNELVNIGESSAGGIGTGVAMGTAGALLALQPRQSDEEPDHRDDRAWVLAAQGLAVAAVAVGVLTFVAFFLDDLMGDGYLMDDLLRFFALVVTVPLVFVLVVGVPAGGLIGGSPGWRRVFAVVGFTVLAVAMFSLANDRDGLFFALPYEKWNTVVGGTFLVGAATALAVSRPVQRFTRSRLDPVSAWLATASNALTIAAAALGLTTIGLLLEMVALESFDAPEIVAAMLMAVSAATLLVANTMLADVRRHRPTILAVLGGVLLLSIITVAVGHSQNVFLAISAWQTAMWFCLPALAAYALTVPAEVRAALGPLVTERQQQPAGQYPPGYQPTPYPPTQYPHTQNPPGPPQAHPGPAPGYPPGYPQGPQGSPPPTTDA